MSSCIWLNINILITAVRFLSHQYYMWTTYEDYTKTSQNYNGTGLSGTNVYSRTNKVFGLSIDYKF